MPDAKALQIANAIMSRLAGIAGVGDTGLVPKAPINIASFPAWFVLGDREVKEPSSFGSTGGTERIELEIVLIFYVEGDEIAYQKLHNAAKDAEAALAAVPFNLGVDGVERAFVKEIVRRNPPYPQSTQHGEGEMVVGVRYFHKYGVS